MRIGRTLSAWALGVGALALGAGCGVDEVDFCKEYCGAAAACAEQSHQMFSYQECKRECIEGRERAASVGCEQRFEDYLDCIVGLHCADWIDVGDYCAAEIDWLDQCLGAES